jgi:hypothetical protein
MRRLIVLATLGLMLTACPKRETSAPPPAGNAGPGALKKVFPTEVKGQARIFVRPDVPNIIEKSLLGSKLGADGNVEAEEVAFTPGQPVSLTLWFHESPPGLQASVRWFAAETKPFAHEERSMNGGKIATFTLKSKLKPGSYRAEGYWGGNLVADKKFTVAKK